jgi:hypothetical protein
MSHTTVLGIGIANCPQDVDSAELMQFIDNADGEFETFSLAPKKPGTIRAAAFDYAVILNAAGSVASIAALLWMAYDKFIAPKKKSLYDDAGLYIVIRKPDGSVIDFLIGREYADRDIFIEDFTEKITAIHKSDDDLGFYAESEAEIKYSEIWVRRK